MSPTEESPAVGPCPLGSCIGLTTSHVLYLPLPGGPLPPHLQNPPQPSEFCHLPPPQSCPRVTHASRGSGCELDAETRRAGSGLLASPRGARPSGRICRPGPLVQISPSSLPKGGDRLQRAPRTLMRHPAHRANEIRGEKGARLRHSEGLQAPGAASAPAETQPRITTKALGRPVDLQELWAVPHSSPQCAQAPGLTAAPATPNTRPHFHPFLTTLG